MKSRIPSVHSRIMERERYDESSEFLLEKDTVPTRWHSNRQRKGALILTWFNVLLFCVSTALLAERHYGFVWGNKKQWLRDTSHYSPLWGSSLEGDLRKIDRQIDGNIFSAPNASKYRNMYTPDPAVDAAWQKLELIQSFPITADDVRKLGKDPEVTVKFPIDYGYGEDAYVAQLDIFHQMHCLNLLRHIAWGEFDRDGKTAKKPYTELHWMHVSHCTEIVAENLLCNANLDVLTFNWVETQDLPFSDFNLRKKCTNFDAIVAWQDANTETSDRARNFYNTEGAKEIPISDDYYRIFGVEKVDLHPGEAHEHQMKQVNTTRQSDVP